MENLECPFVNSKSLKYEMINETMVFHQNDLFTNAFPFLEEIRRQGKLCDVNLIVEGQSFSAHRIVLAATIPYFHGMFLNDMIEAYTKDIQLSCIDAVAVEALINFVYTGRVALDKHNVQSIMSGASFLQLFKVRDACADYLKQRLHPQNALGFKQFADALGCIPLAQLAEKYIETYFHAVSLNEEFLSLSLDALKSLMSRNELGVGSEEHVFEAMMRWVKHASDRKRYIPELLSLVRLPLLSPVYLTDRVAKEDLIKASLPCRDLVDEALTYHLLPERRFLIQTFKVRQRTCNLKGCIFVVGGLNKNGDSLSVVEYFDVHKDEWYLAPSMSMLRSRLGVTVLQGRLYALGGYNGKERLRSVEVFDPIQREWSEVAPMRSKRSALGATVLGDLIYVCGGYDGVMSLNTVECYHSVTNAWFSLAPMTKCRSAGAVVSCHGCIYTIGGHDGLSIFDSVERYDPHSNKWAETTSMLSKRCRLGVALLNGKIYACGGYDGSTFLKTAEVYDPETEKWTYIASMNMQRSRVALTANMGKLWAIGGYDGTSNLNSVEVYDPQANTWTLAPPMQAHEGGVGLGVIPNV